MELVTLGQCERGFDVSMFWASGRFIWLKEEYKHVNHNLGGFRWLLRNQGTNYLSEGHSRIRLCWHQLSMNSSGIITHGTGRSEIKIKV